MHRQIQKASCSEILPTRVSEVHGQHFVGSGCIIFAQVWDAERQWDMFHSHIMKMQPTKTRPREYNSITRAEGR